MAVIEQHALHAALARWFGSAAPDIAAALSWPELQVLQRLPPARACEPGTPAPAPPVLRWLAAAAAAAPESTRALCESLRAAAASLPWRRTYSGSEADSAFLERYGWCELIGPRGPWNSEQLACGFLLLGPETHYPMHRHEAEELYVPLSGCAHWRRGHEDWQLRPPGWPIHHPSRTPHAMRTDSQPLLALYLWRGPGLRDSAALDPAGGDAP